MRTQKSENFRNKIEHPLWKLKQWDRLGTWKWYRDFRKHKFRFHLFLSPDFICCSWSDFICCSWLGAFNGAELVLSIQRLKKNLEGKGCGR
jgi:hypothetical protein